MKCVEPLLGCAIELFEGLVIELNYYGLTTPIESLNSVIRKSIEKHKLFPVYDSVKKVIYLATQQAGKMDYAN